MKKLILPCLALFCLASAQAQLEWAPVGAKYYYDIWYGTLVGQAESTITIEVAGDTVVLGKNCRYLQKAAGDFFPFFHCPGSEITYEEDGRVYFYSEQDQDFILFYDFNKAPGETWAVPFCSNYVRCEEGLRDTFLFRVDAISQIDLNGFQVKVQHLSARPSWEETWYEIEAAYEGIGSLYYPWFIEQGCFIHESGLFGLECYNAPATGTINVRGGSGSCLTASAEADLENSQVALFPNPVSNELEVRFASPPSGKVHFRIFDAQGRLVQNLQKEALTTSIALPAANLPIGMYVLQVLTEGKTWPLQRFVRQ